MSRGVAKGTTLKWRSLRTMENHLPSVLYNSSICKQPFFLKVTATGLLLRRLNYYIQRVEKTLLIYTVAQVNKILRFSFAMNLLLYKARFLQTLFPRIQWMNKLYGNFERLSFCTKIQTNGLALNYEKTKCAVIDWMATARMKSIGSEIARFWVHRLAILCLKFMPP